MKILLVSDQLLKIEGNSVIGTVNFTNTLKRLSRLGELSVCVRDASKYVNKMLVYNDDISDYIRKENVSFIPKSYIWPSGSTIETLKSKIAEVDLVVSYMPALNAEVAALLAHKASKKYFALMVACPWDGLWNQDWKRKIAAPYRYFLNKLILKHADYALYVTREFLQKRYPALTTKSLGLSDVVLEEFDKSILQKRLNKINALPADHVYKLATTAMLNIRYKGQQFVMQALKKLKDMGYKNFTYYLIGGGDDTRLRKTAKQLGIEDQIVFVGKVTHEKVFEILDNIDVYIHPSLQEGLPRSVVEAMSRALPCIGADTGAIPELINHEYIVKKKSSDDMVEKILKIMTPTEMEKEATRNFKEAENYKCHHLDQLRDNFYEKINKDFLHQH